MSTQEEELFIELLLDYGAFNKRFITFAKVKAKGFGWNRQRIQYHIHKWEKENEKQ